MQALDRPFIHVPPEYQGCSVCGQRQAELVQADGGWVKRCEGCEDAIRYRTYWLLENVPRFAPQVPRGAGPAARAEVEAQALAAARLEAFQRATARARGRPTPEPIWGRGPRTRRG